MTRLFLPGFMGTCEDAPFGWDAADWRFEQPAELLGALTPPTALIGYSMGARIALHLAAARPKLVSHLVLISGHPGIDDPGERNVRLQSDRRLARRIRLNFESVLADWYEQPVFAGLAEADMDRLLARRAGQDPWTVARFLETWSVGRMTEGWDWLADLSIPVLAIAGARDEKYVALARRIGALGPHCHTEIVPDAGHIVHIDQADSTRALIDEFLEHA